MDGFDEKELNVTAYSKKGRRRMIGWILALFIGFYVAATVAFIVAY